MDFMRLPRLLRFTAFAVELLADDATNRSHQRHHWVCLLIVVLQVGGIEPKGSCDITATMTVGLDPLVKPANEITAGTLDVVGIDPASEATHA
jgi:hypothetical protein